MEYQQRDVEAKRVRTDNHLRLELLWDDLSHRVSTFAHTELTNAANQCTQYQMLHACIVEWTYSTPCNIVNSYYFCCADLTRSINAQSDYKKKKKKK